MDGQIKHLFCAVCVASMSTFNNPENNQATTSTLMVWAPHLHIEPHCARTSGNYGRRILRAYFTVHVATRARECMRVCALYFAFRTHQFVIGWGQIVCNYRRHCMRSAQRQRIKSSLHTKHTHTHAYTPTKRIRVSGGKLPPTHTYTYTHR